jgi:hypothetical protein
MKLVNGLFWLLTFTSAMLRAQTTAVRPYSFTEVATQYDEAGQPKLEYRMVHAVNSAGTSVTQDASPGAGGVRQIVKNGLQTVVDPSTRSAVSGPLAGREQSSASASCTHLFRVSPGMRLRVLGAARIGGVAVDRITLESAEAQNRVELLLAPSLGCVLLGEKSFRAGRLIRRVEAVNLRLSEPDPSLFEIPFDYIYTKVEREMKK